MRPDRCSQGPVAIGHRPSAAWQAISPLGAARCVFAFALSTSLYAAPPVPDDQFNEFWSPDSPAPSGCNSILLNNSPLGLPRCMHARNIGHHLQMLQDIATANGGTRAAGLPGCQASVGYVKQTLEQAGYQVTLQPFPFTAFYPQGPGELAQLAPVPTDYQWEQNFTYLSYLSQSDPGDILGNVAAVDLQLGCGQRRSPHTTGAAHRSSGRLFPPFRPVASTPPASRSAAARIVRKNNAARHA